MSRSEVGQFVFHELNTSDQKKARAFYGEVFGWSFQDLELGELGEYTMFAREGADLGGIAPLEQGGQSHWLPYVAVDDVDATVKRVVVLGGKVNVPPTNIPNMGRFAIIADPTGAALAVFRGGN